MGRLPRTVSVSNEAHHAKLPYRLLAKLPEDQIRFLLTGARIANDVLVHQRLLIALENSHKLADKDEQQASTVAWFSAVSLLAGKLWEGHRAIERLWKPSDAIKLDPVGAHALAKLSMYLERKSPINKVRNQVAFHYDSKYLLNREVASFKELVASDSEMEWLLGSELANTIYLFSAASNTLAILDAAYHDLSKQDQMQALYDAVVEAAELMGQFLQYAIMAILVQKGIEADDHITTEPIDMANRPKHSDLRFTMLTRSG